MKANMNNLTVNDSVNSDLTIGINTTPAAQPAPAPAPAPKQPSIYGEVPQIPVLDAVEGIKFDFNEGIRILFPHNGKEYHVTFTDIDTGVILDSADTVPGAYVTSVKKFFIRFRLIIHEKGGKDTERTSLPLCDKPEQILHIRQNSREKRSFANCNRGK